MAMTISRGEKDSEKWNDYSGIFYRFTFKVDTPISLTAVSFFGPHPSNGGENHEYKVYLKIDRSFHNNDGGERNFMPETMCRLTAQTGEKFKVQFKPIDLRAGEYIDIRFELKGPPTEHLLQEEVFKTTLFDGTGSVKVDCLLGSKQLSDLHFDLI